MEIAKIFYLYFSEGLKISEIAKELKISEVNVKKDDTIKRGELIGKSGTNAIYTKDYNLHFELCYQGKFIDPETSYNKSQDEL